MKQTLRLSRRLDKPSSLALKRAADLPSEVRPGQLKIIIGDGVTNREPTAKGTKLEKLEERLELLENATRVAAKSDDTFIALALKLRPAVQASESRADAYEGTTSIDRPLFANACATWRQVGLMPTARFEDIRYRAGLPTWRQGL